MKKLFSIMSNLQTHYHFKLDFQKVDHHTGGRLNKKDGLTRYGDSHVKDKTS